MDRLSRVRGIGVPVYQVAGPAVFSNAAFPFLPEGNKWLRLAPSYHLDDYYTPRALESEKRFFDRYLKGVDNGWEHDTPPVSIEVMEPGAAPATTRTAQSWPVEGTVYRKLHLDTAAGRLADEPAASESEVRYDAITGKTTFTYEFVEDIEVTGFLKARLWAECDGSDDMDLFVSAVKLGGPVPVPVPVGSGQQRASLRDLDPSSTDWLPVPSLTASRPLAAGEVVPVEISLRATFLIFRAGARLVLTVSSNPESPPALPGAQLTLAGTDSADRGVHILRSGGERNSFLQIPTLPFG